MAQTEAPGSLLARAGITLRGAAAINAGKVACDHGNEFDEANAYRPAPPVRTAVARLSLAA